MIKKETFFEIPIALPDHGFLLQKIAQAEVEGADSFTPAAKFRAGRKEHLQIARVSRNCSNFVKVFGTEKRLPGARLVVNQLLRNSLNGPILAELGAAAETGPYFFFELLKRQGSGETGVLLADGGRNAAYVAHPHGTTWFLSAAWKARRGWLLDAGSAGSFHRWLQGELIISF